MPMREYNSAETPAPLFVLEETTSTFDAAWDMAERERLPDWSSVVALTQTEGRGQLRREWFSPPGNLYVSFFLPQSISCLGGLASLAVGWCVCEALAAEGVRTRLKWPNDILLTRPAGRPGGREGKFGGLLLEERDGRTVAGLGLNLRTAPSADRLRANHAVPAVALPACHEQPQVFWARLLPALIGIYETEIAPHELDAIRQKIEARLAWLGEKAYAEDAGVTGRILGIECDGTLRLECGEETVPVFSGSVVPV